MSDTIDFSLHLKTWINTVLKSVNLLSTIPEDNSDFKGISLYLMETIPTRLPRGNEPQTWQIYRRYLITAWNSTPEQESQMLEELIFAAMQTSGFEIEFQPLPISYWAAFKLQPRPSLLLKVPHRRTLEEKAIPLVQEPPAIIQSIL